MRLVVSVAVLLSVAAGALLGARSIRAPQSTTGSAAPTSAPASVPAALRARGPLDLIPSDALLCWKALPAPGAALSVESGPSALGTLVGVLNQIGQNLRPQTQLWIGIFETFGIVVKYPFAVGLLDAKAITTASGRGKQLSDAKVAIVAKMDGEFVEVRRKIQTIMNSLTDASTASLVEKTAGGFKYQELTDKRLGSWIIAWGALGEHFVITFGPNVWPTIAETALGQRKSLADDTWLAAARARQSPEPLIEIVSQSSEIRARLDPLVDGRATAFFKAWDAQDVERAYWALGFEDRAMYCAAEFFGEQGTRRRLYADPKIRDQKYLATIPAESRYAIYRLPVQWLLPRLFSGYYATQDAADRLAAEQRFAKIQADHGFDADKDLLQHLGDTFILHNYPQHPLHLPLAFTTLIEIRGDAQRVRKTIDTICNAWRDALDEAADKNADFRAAVLERESDGTWHFRYAVISGVAWTVTDKFLISSYSPSALKEYLATAAGAAGQVIP